MAKVEDAWPDVQLASLIRARNKSRPVAPCWRRLHRRRSTTRALAGSGRWLKGDQECGGALAETGTSAPAAIEPTPHATSKNRFTADLSSPHLTYFTSSIDTRVASVQVMSTLSPTFTFASAAVSFTFVWNLKFCGPVKVIDGSLGSIAVIVAVIVR